MSSIALCAVADDEHAGDVVATGTRLARAFALRPLFVHVEAPFRPVDADTARSGGAADSRPSGDAVLASLGITSEQAHVVVDDRPSEALARLLRVRDVRMIVTGSRGRGAVASGVLGSVSRALVSRRHAPVVVVRAGATTVAAGGPVLCGLPASAEPALSLARAATRIARRLEATLALLQAAVRRRREEASPEALFRELSGLFDFAPRPASPPAATGPVAG